MRSTAWQAAIVTATIFAAGLAQAAVPHGNSAPRGATAAERHTIDAASLGGFAATAPAEAGEAKQVAGRVYRGPRRGWRHRYHRGRPYARRYPRRIYRGPRVIIAPPIYTGYRAPCVRRVVRVRPNGAVVTVVRPCRGYRYW
ncbi:MAG: hypothetical protein AAFW98_13065 [Pseudomonadota bacterium]